MRRFEFSDGKSNKFWEVEVEGSRYTTCHGRIGTPGRETSKTFASASAADKKAESAIRSKLKKGYIEVGANASAEAETREDVSPLAAIEQVLIAKPDDYASWEIYADMLSTAGDPRSELIMIGISLAGLDPAALKGKQGKQLRAREDELLQKYAAAWFGKFVSDDEWRECFGWTLETGFWGRVRLWVDYDHKGTDMAKALTHALAHPSAKFLAELDLGLPSAEGDANYAGCVRALARHGPLASLRRLTIGDFVYPDESEISWVHVGDVGKLWKTLPKLERLRLQGAGIGLGTPNSTSLRELELCTGGLPGAAGESLGRAKLPKLERLIVWFGTQYYQGSCTPDHARRILDNASFTELRTLALANADFGDGLAEVVAQASALPPKLEVLDLSMGNMSDAGAELLLARADVLGGLETLDLSQNGLSEVMCARLGEALPNVRTEPQKGGHDGQYVSVGE